MPAACETASAAPFALRSGTPSASSSRIVVASVNGRRPESAFSSVERLILASSARRWREMRRRASSSRISAATDRLSSPESSVSEVATIEAPPAARLRTTLTVPHPPFREKAVPGGSWPKKLEHHRRGPKGNGTEEPRVRKTSWPKGAEPCTQSITGGADKTHPRLSPFRRTRAARSPLAPPDPPADPSRRCGDFRAPAPRASQWRRSRGAAWRNARRVSAAPKHRARRLRRGAPHRHGLRYRGERPDRPRPRHAGLPQPDRGL